MMMMIERRYFGDRWNFCQVSAEAGGTLIVALKAVWTAVNLVWTTCGLQDDRFTTDISFRFTSFVLHLEWIWFTVHWGLLRGGGRGRGKGNATKLNSKSVDHPCKWTQIQFTKHFLNRGWTENFCLCLHLPDPIAGTTNGLVFKRDGCDCLK